MVVIAFLLMGIVSYYSTNNSMRERLLENSDSALKIIEAHIAEGAAWLRSTYPVSLNLFSKSYAFILNQDLGVIGHPENSHIGRYLRNFNSDYRQIAEALPLSGEISNRQITEIDGKPAMIHMRQILRDWYMGHDIVFIDHMMPGMDGIEAAASIGAAKTVEKAKAPEALLA
jgi:CheY-like chemotaxis protein